MSIRILSERKCSWAIPSRLRPDEVGRLIALAETLSFVDGRVSNQGNPIKHNPQVDRESPNPQGHLEPARIVSEALERSTKLHEVLPVSAGSRVVSVVFIESMIADEYLRSKFTN